MKIESRVVGVRESGEDLELTLRGWPTTAAEGVLAGDYRIDIPANERNKRAFYIGRDVVISVEPR